MRDRPRAAHKFPSIYSEIERYYTEKALRHVPTALGVDWSCVPTQELRFVQLLRVCDFDGPLSINDLGCGYGGLLAFLAMRFRGKPVDYLGIDLSPAMISQAHQLWAKRPQTKFAVGSTLPRVADYTIASGIFNVKLHQPVALWAQYVQTTLAQMHDCSKRGFAVNFLAPPTANVKCVPELYRAAPDTWRDYCIQAFGAHVTVLADYGMPEYTLLVHIPP